MNSEPLINYLLQFGSLNQQQIDLINASLTVRNYKADAYFLKAGQVSREIGFIIKGVVRVCYYDNEGNEITRYFIDENNFLVDIESYNAGIPSIGYVQAVTDCEMLILSKQAMENLSNTIIVWDSIVHKMIAKGLSEKVARISLMFPKDATERYLFFLEKFPNLANRVPLQYIASYIGITKHSLSRIRKSIR
ncbi:Crp/Fnr family transcriptional regulator [Filimonas effusa]|uniref:Crp/Fnr family transcriptional regulator n=1 Tax=Filimonas effusa TaxID=2508721 RepID=A0A4Q1D8P3_9BACT|nr:Crp/Fnr family transcriptional regulator [Filimonas effusa]RXK85724.1 Crp/Fnr family transcriptional regulator [Filimonas effusa]